jgi:hypothetical protein
MVGAFALPAAAAHGGPVEFERVVPPSGNPLTKVREANEGGC